jgi:N-formylglutamate amidohydrolase
MRKINLWICACALLVVTSCKKDGGKETGGGLKPPESYQPNTTVYGSNKYVRFLVGDLKSPIILASPHDGTIAPSSMPLRDHPDAVTVRDLYVTDLVLQISDALYQKTGLRPHVIINDVARSRMEPNRDLNETYHKSEAANDLWKEYHAFLKGAQQMVQNNVGKGLFLDMHGHGHTKQRIEVGYIVSKANLNNTDAVLNSVPGTSSIYHLANSSPYTFSQLIRGDFAFGTLLANQGIPAVPSKQDPKPNSDDYFNGGYCTLAYGSRNGGAVSAIQLETHGSNLRNNASQRKASGAKIADAIIEYMKEHYGLLQTKQ